MFSSVLPPFARREPAHNQLPESALSVGSLLQRFTRSRFLLPSIKVRCYYCCCLFCNEPKTNVVLLALRRARVSRVALTTNRQHYPSNINLFPDSTDYHRPYSNIITKTIELFFPNETIFVVYFVPPSSTGFYS